MLKNPTIELGAVVGMILGLLIICTVLSLRAVEKQYFFVVLLAMAVATALIIALSVMFGAFSKEEK